MLCESVGFIMAVYAPYRHGKGADYSREFRQTRAHGRVYHFFFQRAWPRNGVLLLVGDFFYFCNEVRAADDGEAAIRLRMNHTQPRPKGTGRTGHTGSGVKRARVANGDGGAMRSRAGRRKCEWRNGNG